MLTSAEIFLADASSSTISAQVSITSRTSIISSLKEATETNQLSLNRLNSSLSTLQMRVNQALNSAAMVSTIQKSG